MKFGKFGLKAFTRLEIALWLGSATVIVSSFLISRNTEPLYLITSLIGATALVLVSKGNVWGQVLTVVFSILYGIISHSYAYYGEMITYLGMTLPIAAASVVTWLCHPYRGRRSEVEVGRPALWEHLLIWGLGIAVTVGFFFLLAWLNTESLLVSTLSVFTSFLAVMYSMRRSPLYALAYAANDTVLILLWISASLSDRSYLCMVFCFAAFLVNDLYGFFNWRRMEKRQRRERRQG